VRFDLRDEASKVKTDQNDNERSAGMVIGGFRALLVGPHTSAREDPENLLNNEYIQYPRKSPFSAYR